MSVLNWLLLSLGYAARHGWHALGAFLAALGHGLDRLLNPVLSPLLGVLNPFCTAAGNAVYALLAPLPVWAGLLILSAISGVLMLIAFRYTSHQKAIGRARDDITANLLALKLYKDELRVTFRAQARLLAALGRLQIHMLLPVLVLALPLMLVVAQIGLRHQWRPLRPGEWTILTVRLSESAATGTDRIEDAVLADSPGVAEAVGPVPGGGALVWRIRAGEPGRHTLRIEIPPSGGAAGNTLVVEKLLVVGEPFQPVSAERPGKNWTAQILHPFEPPLPPGPVTAVQIAYGGFDSRIYGANWWLLTFFVVSLVFALLLKPVFRVRF